MVVLAPGERLPWRDPGADALAEQVARSIAAGDPQGAIELQLAVWAL